MNLQVLIATVNSNINELLNNTNIQTDAIICNQCDNTSYEEKEFSNKKIKVFNFIDRGVGINRNNALMRADADIVLIADDDIEYINNYEKIILDEFKNNSKADMIIFNLETNDKNRPRFQIKKRKRVRKYNCLRYGAVRLAVKLDRIKEKNIYFSLLFGGGAKYSAGEDSLFIMECLRKGLKIYTSPKYIGVIKENESSWFTGYNDKYFIDKGAFFKCLSPKFVYIWVFQYIVRKYTFYKKYKSIKEVSSLLFKGVKLFNSNRIFT